MDDDSKEGWTIKPKANILIIDDEEAVVEMLTHALELQGFRTIGLTDGAQAIAVIEAGRPDLVLLDLKMPDADGLQILADARKRNLAVPIVIMTGFSSMESAISAIRMGAKDYLTKPLNLRELDSLVSKVIGDRDSRRELPSGGGASALSSRFGMIGSSPAMIEVYKLIGAVSKTLNSSTILITGESGSGKELVARQIHNFGDRASSPFIALNMTALPDTLIESELFGYEKGAFTGATKQVKGLFEEAGDGTIFLDEIGGISPNMQQKLLRVLQEREYRRVGGRATLSVVCRVISATNSDLAALSAKGDFRADLFHRLNVVQVRIPPLRERVSDIPRITEFFLQETARELGRQAPVLSSQAHEMLCRYLWPGNVRELRNVISRALIVNSSGLLGRNDFPGLEEDPPVIAADIEGESLDDARRKTVESFERAYLERQLKRFNGKIPLAAEASKVTPQRFYQLMNKYGFRSEEFKA